MSEMKKSLFAIGAIGVLLGQAAPVRAQSSVTLYGLVDTAVEYVNRVSTASGTGGRVGMTGLGGLAPSRWGLRGAEDLGGGLQSVFWLESGFAPDTGALTPSATSPLFARQASVGLKKNGVGLLTFGRQYTSLFDGVANFAPMRLATTYEPVAPLVGLSYREDNMVKYAGDFGSWHVGAHYSFGTGTPLQGGQPTVSSGGEIPGNHRAQTGYGATGYYVDGKLGVGLGYDQVNPQTASGIGVERKATIGASYVLGAARLFGGYRWRDSVYANDNTAVRDNFYWTGIYYQATPALGLTAAYYYNQVKAASLSASAPAQKQPNFSQLSLLADYSLSKRTDVYLSASWSHNGALNYDSVIQTGGLYGYGSPASITGLANGQKDMIGVAAGLRLVF